MKKMNIGQKLKHIQSACFKKLVSAFLAASMLVSSSSVSTVFGEFNSEDIHFETAVQTAEDETGDSETTGDNDKIYVSKFDIEILSGYNRNEDGLYVWDAENPLDGHSFIFNILFETSGEGKLDKGTVNITIPASVFGDNFDMLEMSMPYYTEITDDLGVEHSWAYKFDEAGNVVIFNIKDVPAGNAYNFNFAYTTTKKTYYYEDMQPSKDVKAKLELLESTPSEENPDPPVIKEQDAGPLNVAINTTAKINNTTKKSPQTMYDSWNALWGDEVKPKNDGDYYYLVWEVESVVDPNSTQFYDFTLSDQNFNIISVTPPEKTDAFDPAGLKVLGYNYFGNGNTYLLDPDTVYEQDIFGVRHDYVLTAVPKEWYDNLEPDEKIVIQNTVDATVHPADNDEDKSEDTTASSSQTFSLQKPKFTAPNGSYRITKKGDRRNYLLDKFAYETNTSIPDYVYDISMTGYSYADTYAEPEDISGKGENYDPKSDYTNYGKNPLHYEITDEEVSVAGLIGEVSNNDYKLTKDDYYFNYIDIAYDFDMVKKGDEAFDDASKTYNRIKPVLDSGYTVYLDIFGEFSGDGNYEKIATVAVYRSADSAAIEYDDGMQSKAKIKYITDRNIRVEFSEKNCTGYKIVTSDECYYSAQFNIQIGIQLNRTEGLLKWINSAYYDDPKPENEEAEDRITELQLTNKAEMAVFHKDNTVVPASVQYDYGTDYQNESKRQSAITKSVTAVKNNPLYKRYEISWRIDISEVVLSNGSTPVTQNGGTFYDLLPQGSSVDLSTVQVYKENNTLVESTAKTMAGTGNRVLLKVVVEPDQPGDKYSLVFTSYHTWEDISAFGINVLNPVAYVSGNEDMSDLPDKNNPRGNDKNGSIDLMKDNIPEEDFSEYDVALRAIFNYAVHNIKALVASNVGVSKTVKNAKEGSYSTETIVDENTPEYSYRLRFENGTTTKSINNIFVDFLEAYTAHDNTHNVASEWRGKLKSIDVTNLTSKNILPVVYYSTTPFLVNKTEVSYTADDKIIYLVDGEKEITAYESDTAKYGSYYEGIRHFLPKTAYDQADNNVIAGEANGFWQVLDSSYYTNGIYSVPEEIANNITAIAIDFTYADVSKFEPEEIESTDPDADKDKVRVRTDGTYIVGMNEAAYVIMTMDSSEIELKSKDVYQEENNISNDDIDAAYKAYINSFCAYNDIFIATKYYDRILNDFDIVNDSFIEQSYTTVRKRVRKDFHLLKVNSENTDQTIGGITFNLKGVSDYGTAIDITLTTNSNGRLEFDDIEIGTYILKELDSGRDWLRDNTEYTVTVYSNGKITVSPELYAEHYSPAYDETDHSKSDNPFILENTPRIHADISFDKKVFKGKDMPFGTVVPGARFMLSGDSDYNNKIEKFAVSDFYGKVVFEDVEKGTYTLKEIEAPEGYALSNVVYTVFVDKNGNWSITDTSYDPTDDTDYSLLDGDPSNGYTIGNEKYQEFYLLKLSTQAVGVDEEYLLEGAEFSLTGFADDGTEINMTAKSGNTSKYGPGTAYFGNLPYGTYYLQETKAPTYSYTDTSGNDVDQEFHIDNKIYKVTVDQNGVSISGLNLYEAEDIEDDDLFAFYNIPKGKLVVVHKVWQDDKTDEERIDDEKINPDIAISKDPPDPFRLVYAEFDYSYPGQKSGNLGIRFQAFKDSKKAISAFKRYTDGNVTFSATEKIEANGTTYPKLLIGGQDVGAVIVSTKNSTLPIYGWFDEATSNYYWYTEAAGGKMPTARDLFTGIVIENVDFNGVNFTETSSFAYMFNSCNTLVSVTNFSRPEDATASASAQSMFFGCSKLSVLDLSEFYTTGITDMQSMFYQCRALTRLDISHFDTSQVNNMQSMFAQCTSLVEIDFGGTLNTEKVTSFSSMFDACSKLVSLKVNEIKIMNNAEVSLMFFNCNALPNIPKLIRQKPAQGSKNISAKQMFYGCKNLAKDGTLDLSEFDTTGISNMESMFHNAFQEGSGTTLKWGTALNTESVTTFYHMFDTCNKLIKIDAAEINADGVTAASGFEFMFCNAQVLRSIPSLKRSSTASGTGLSMQQMFYQCFALEAVDLSEFSTVGVTNMQSLFQGCSMLASPDLSSFDTSSVTNMSTMFMDCKKITSLNFESFDTSNVTNMSNMLAYCTSLTEVDISSFTKDNLKSANSMFKNCTALVTIYADESFDLSEIAAGSGDMFEGDKMLTLRIGVPDEDKPNQGTHAFVNGLHGSVRGYFTYRAATTASIRSTDKEENAVEVQSSIITSMKQSLQVAADKIQSYAQIKAALNAESDTNAESSGGTSGGRKPDGNEYRNSANHGNQSYYDGCPNEDSFYVFKSLADLAVLKEKIDELANIIAELEGDESRSKELAEKKELLREYEEIYNLVRNLAVAEVENIPEDGGEPVPEEIWKASEWIYIFCNVVGEDFHAWEENVPNGYESDFDNFVVNEEDETGRTTIISGGTATITNTLKKMKFGTLTICKKVSNADTNAETEDQDLTYREPMMYTKYQFEIYLSNMESGFSQQIEAYYFDTRDEANTDAYEKVSVNFDESGKATVQIQSGYSLKFVNLPEGVDYIVREVLPEGDTTVQSTTITAVNDTGAVIDKDDRKITGKIVGNTDVNVQYDNAIDADLRKLGAFQLEKRVVNENGDVDPNFEYVFMIEFTNLAKNTEYHIYQTVIEDGKETEKIVRTFSSNSDQSAIFTVKLKDGETLTFKNIPYDAVYRIIEAENEAYISSYEITDEIGTNVKESDANSNSNVSLGTSNRTMGDETNGDKITFTNNIVKMQRVTLTKTVGGETEFEEDGTEKIYTFHAEFSNLGAGYLLDAGDRGLFTANAQGTASFTFFLKSQETITFTNVPVGAKYVIYEECEGMLIPYYEVSYTDETTGESKPASPNPVSPSTKTADEIAKAIEKAEVEVSEKKKAEGLAASQLSSEKNALNSKIAEIVNSLGDNSELSDKIIAAFTADNCVDENGDYTASYLEARDKILTVAGDNYKAALEELEKKVSETAKAYTVAYNELEKANAALLEARGASYISGTVELHRNTDITFYNNNPINLMFDKTVTGDFGDKSREFRFKAIFTYNGEPFAGHYTAETNGGARITDSDYLKDNTTQAFGDDGTVYFVLKHGGKITFKGLPYGTSYTIVEEEAEDYEVIIDGTVIDDRTCFGIIEEDTAVTYENHWNGLVAELPGAGTGIGRKLFYQLGLFMMTEGLIGAMLYYRRRKRYCRT